MHKHATPAPQMTAIARSAEAAPPWTPSFGALPSPDGTTLFRLWAPDKEYVALELAGRAPIAMHPGPGGFFEVRTDCAPGSRYRYRVAPDLTVPDPASRLQDGDVHDASIVVMPGIYPWVHPDWRGRPWTDAVLYEIHAGLAGGFRGIEKQLAQLVELGITAIELMPIADFPGPRNWGYDGVLPYAPDNAYGTPDDLRHLVDTAHGLGLMVFLDVVYNHFGPDGNYLSSYAGRFFRHDVHTPWGPAIDFREAAVRRFFAENALYWLTEFRFDGLRLDAVHAIHGQGWLEEMAQFVRTHIGADRHIHLILENDDNAASLMSKGFDAQWNDDGHHILHFLLTGETQGYYAAYTDEPTRKLARFLSDGFIYQGEPTIVREGRGRGEPSAQLAPTAFVFFLQNHDQIGNRAWGERLGTLMGQDAQALRAAVALQLLSPQIPLIFMGEEYGSLSPFLYFTSFEQPELAQAVFDGRRNEFADHNAATGAHAHDSSIPNPNDMHTYNASLPCKDSDPRVAESWNNYYRKLLAIRSQFITPRLPGARSIGARRLAERAVMAQWRLGDNSILTIYANFNAHSVQYGTATGFQPKGATVLFESVPGAFDATGTLRLPAKCTIASLGTIT